MITIYHNPRCSKSREALALLQKNGADFTIIEYLKTPPTAAELAAILIKLNIPARQLLRDKEEEYRSLQLNNLALSEQQLINTMVEHPKLIERPIVINGEHAAIGRPLSNVSAIL
ncbi:MULTISPECIES: arsenate reductase (glutaredoxin) [unclassified Arsukibacterium]|uniref:arsenate reductase (glutaredoxin) n=1 Tax=unclassified Arsukibacterium TaxID=2635278 RepID=UPI000C425E13|nr:MULTISPECIES: arsenate reductase (glutaredoxin) [unclassified Arsukibacterium]MAA93142.1 arsenate reductase (glutaredoxin) [Rheinheimera sp.]MAA94722.1 arsenate reductase (glutaredoxin) [Rheinheimera sp.]MBM33920.1 arsenate reductase (glutaredoxin) [Rheinheimera sp.]HAW93713.1 arsenate reductase (glutaredoxin) [Candidatus Azambacteria bacterium]|tara:strand:- start:32875 stop:33219 length:345 start_codon:yes stop_codon:yes gene_type:complete